jgi:hypothetical protein
MEKAMHPMSFEENRGQFGTDVKFQSSIGDTFIRFLDGAVSFARVDQQIHGADTIRECAVWNLEFQNADVSLIQPIQKNLTKVNYLKTDSEGQIIGEVSRFKELTYPELYPNIDLRYYFQENGHLKYDLILKPGFDLDQVVFAYSGIEDMALDPKGNLRISTPKGEYIDEVPFSFQNRNKTQKVIDISYKLLGQGRFGFELKGEYDEKQDIILDPGALIWGTYVQSSTSGEFYENIDIDPSGNIILGGGSMATDYPTTPGVYQLANAGNRDATVTKISADGTTILWATYFGGSLSDNISDLFLMPSGEILFAGTTNSTDLPTTASAYQSSINGTQD